MVSEKLWNLKGERRIAIPQLWRGPRLIYRRLSAHSQHGSSHHRSTHRSQGGFVRQPPCKAAASRPEDVARFAQLGIAASVQYTHATSDRDLVEASGPTGWSMPTRSARCGLRALDLPAARTPWSRSSIHSPGCAPRPCPRTPSARLGAPEQAIPADAALRSFTVEPASLRLRRATTRTPTRPTPTSSP